MESGEALRGRREQQAPVPRPRDVNGRERVTEAIRKKRKSGKRVQRPGPPGRDGRGDGSGYPRYFPLSGGASPETRRRRARPRRQKRKDIRNSRPLRGRAGGGHGRQGRPRESAEGPIESPVAPRRRAREAVRGRGESGRGRPGRARETAEWRGERPVQPRGERCGGGPRPGTAVGARNPVQGAADGRGHSPGPLRDENRRRRASGDEEKTGNT